MQPSQKLPTWATRVKPHLIRRIYENDALGLCDEDLLDQVGWALYARCESFIFAMESSQGRARCASCGEIVLHHHQSNETLHCWVCGWECSYRAYRKTIEKQQLSGGTEVTGLFQNYNNRFPKAKNFTEKMLLIDQLIHGFHHSLISGRTRRPVGVNLIDGNLEFVIHFLDQLTCGPESTPGIQQNLAQWRENISSSRKRK